MKNHKNFSLKGGDHVFEDLDRAMQKMEHWAHRMYPKLPFDNTMARVSVLGKKMQIQHDNACTSQMHLHAHK